MIDMNALYYFRHLARTQNMSRTAQELHVTQPTLSKSLTRLEEQVGYPLFDRVHGKITLNENGLFFLDTVDRMFMEYHDGLEQIRNIAKHGLGSITYGTDVPTLLEQTISSYILKHPACRIREFQEPVESSAQNLIDNKIDFALTTRIPQNGKLSGIPFISEKILLVSGPNTRMPEGNSVRLADFFSVPFICNEMELNQSQILFFCQQAGFGPDIRWSSCDGRMMNELLMNSMGIALVPAHTILHTWQIQGDTSVQVRAIEDVDCRLTVNLLKRKSGRFSLSAQEYLTFVRKQLQVLAQQWPESITVFD